MHRTEGRRFIYRPPVSEAQVRRSMVDELTDRLFAGDSSALVTHLLEEHPVSAEDLDEIRRAIATHESPEEE